MSDIFDNERGACKGSPTSWWFPDHTTSGRNNGRKAVRICNSCPIISDCRTYAMRNETHGIWGGLREGEMEIERRRRGIMLTPEARSSISNGAKRKSAALTQANYYG
jgi:WhiB family redox-sensing transcriptional regulator